MDSEDDVWYHKDKLYKVSYAYIKHSKNSIHYVDNIYFYFISINIPESIKHNELVSVNNVTLHKIG